MSRILRNTNIHLLPKFITVAKVSKHDLLIDKLTFMNIIACRNKIIPVTSSIPVFIQHRNFHCNSLKSQNKNENDKEAKDLVKSYENPYAGLAPAEKVKEASKDATYLGVIVVGIGIFGYIFYTLFGELFSSSSTNGLYTHAYKQCKLNTQIKDICGEPLKGYGETTRRGRRRHVSHVEYMEAGVKCIRMKFYIEGPHNKGTVTLEAKQNDRKKYEIQFIYVEFGGQQRRVIVIEDNR